jgi:V/A-type H+-transporting ATPase subunit I
VIELRDEVEKMNEEKRLIEAEIHRVAPFGDFSMQDIDYIQEEAHRKIQFFCKKTDKTSSSILGPEVIYISTEYDLDYFISINPSARTYPGMIEMRIDRSVSELKCQLQFLNEAIHDLEFELKSYAGHKEFLHEALLEQLNLYHLSEAKKEVNHPIESTGIFSIEAWVPKSKESLLFTLLDGLSVHCERIKIEDQDRVPTVMENEGANKMGEDLVKIYDTPATTDKDPSGWVFWSFALFFAMIVADGGYGFLYLGLALYMKYKFPTLEGYSKRLLRMVIILSAFVIVWGTLTCSFFGLNLSRNSFLGEISPTQYMVKKKAAYHLERKDDVYQDWVHEFPKVATAKNADEFLDYTVSLKGHRYVSMASVEFNDNILLELSLFVGVIHLSLSFLRYLKTQLSRIRLGFIYDRWVSFFPHQIKCHLYARVHGIDYTRSC